jgi:hypothetical protein
MHQIDIEYVCLIQQKRVMRTCPSSEHLALMAA